MQQLQKRLESVVVYGINVSKVTDINGEVSESEVVNFKTKAAMEQL